MENVDTDKEDLLTRKLTERAVEIASKVNKYVHREVGRQTSLGHYSPFDLEAMTLAYTTAMSKFSLYKVLKEHGNQNSWEEFKMSAFQALTIAFKHVETEMEKGDPSCH